jgi:hypothetical protein
MLVNNNETVFWTERTSESIRFFSADDTAYGDTNTQFSRQVTNATYTNINLCGAGILSIKVT